MLPQTVGYYEKKGVREKKKSAIVSCFAFQRPEISLSLLKNKNTPANYILSVFIEGMFCGCC